MHISCPSESVDKKFGHKDSWLHNSHINSSNQQEDWDVLQVIQVSSLDPINGWMRSDLEIFHFFTLDILRTDHDLKIIVGTKVMSVETFCKVKKVYGIST